MPLKAVGLAVAYLLVGYAVTLLSCVLVEWIGRRDYAEREWKMGDTVGSDWGIMAFATLMWPLCVVFAFTWGVAALSVWLLTKARLAHWLYEVPLRAIDGMHNGRMK